MGASPIIRQLLSALLMLQALAVAQTSDSATEVWPEFDFYIKSRSKMAMFRFGYIYSHPKNNSGAAMENMATGEATGRVHLPNPGVGRAARFGPAPVHPARQRGHRAVGRR